MSETLTPESRREIRSYVEWQISQVDPKKAVCYTMLPLPDLSQKIALLDALDAAEARIDLLNEHISVLMAEADEEDARAIGKEGE